MGQLAANPRIHPHPGLGRRADGRPRIAQNHGFKRYGKSDLRSAIRLRENAPVKRAIPGTRFDIGINRAVPRQAT